MPLLRALCVARAKVLIRAEQHGDREAIFALNNSAFDTPSEANLVDSLRTQATPIISLVAEQDGEVIGHILFSPVTLVGHSDITILGLGPMAVAPEHQHQGIGSALVQAGLEHCRELGVEAVVVLGHPTYYPRFGFVPASRFAIDSEYDAPDEAFMALELKAGRLSGTPGRVKYHRVFSDA